MRRAILLLLLLFAPLPAAAQPALPAIFINEFLTDPKNDWNEDGKITGSDEYVELRNLGSRSIHLTGWSLLLNDSTPAMYDLAGTIEPGGFATIINPTGELNNNGHMALRDPNGSIIDEVRFGTWPGAAGPPGGGSTKPEDESVAKWADGTWAKAHATPGFPNEDPRWSVSDDADAQAINGYVAPNATIVAQATLVHRDVSGPSLDLWIDEGHGSTLHWSLISSSVAAAGVSFNVNSTTTYWWSTNGTTIPWRSQNVSLVVDAEAPSMPTPSNETIWVNQSAIEWFVPEATDRGAGNITWQSRRSNDTANESDWSRSIHLENVSAPVTLDVRARDALNNTSPWIGPWRVGSDAVPPSAVPNLTANGDGPFTLSWSPAADDSSGVDEYELTRLLPNAETWPLHGNQTAFVDSITPGRAAVQYRLVAIDAAGNEGPPMLLDVDHEGLHPHITGVRLSRPAWSDGVQEIRVDFDRDMNISLEPRIESRGKTVQVQSARWFANASTYGFTLPDSHAFEEGPVSLSIQNVRSEGGAFVESGYGIDFVVDRSKPLIVVDTSAGWTRNSTINVTTVDQGPVRVGWRLWPAGTPEGPEWNATTSQAAQVPLPTAGNWTLRLAAQDHAGNNALAFRETYRVDVDPPEIGALSPRGTAWLLEVEDSLSGVNWSRMVTTNATEWDATPDARRGHVMFEPTPNATAMNATLTVSDVAGNIAVVMVSLVATAPAPLVEEANDSTAMDRVTLALEEVQDSPPRSARNATWWLAPIMGGMAASVPLIRRKRGRRRSAPPQPKMEPTPQSGP